MDSVFNPNQFFEQSIEAGFETRLVNVPDGEWTANIGSEENDLEARMSKSNNPMLVVNFYVTDAEAAEATGRENPRVQFFIVLDVDENGNLEHGPGKNIKLGQLLKAAGMNSGSVNLNELRGAGPMKVRVTSNLMDEDDPDSLFSSVQSVAAA